MIVCMEREIEREAIYLVHSCEVNDGTYLEKYDRGLHD